MLADRDDRGAGPYPCTRRRVGIEVVDRTAAGVPAVECVLRRAVGALRHGLVKLPIVEAGERELFDCDTKQALEILKGNA